MIAHFSTRPLLGLTLASRIWRKSCSSDWHWGMGRPNSESTLYVPPWIFNFRDGFCQEILGCLGGNPKNIYIYIYFNAHPLLRGFNNLLILEGSHRYTQPLVYHVVGMAHLPKKMGDGPKPDLVDPPKENKEAKFKDQTRTKRKQQFWSSPKMTVSETNSGDLPRVIWKALHLAVDWFFPSLHVLSVCKVRDQIYARDMMDLINQETLPNFQTQRPFQTLRNFTVLFLIVTNLI